MTTKLKFKEYGAYEGRLYASYKDEPLGEIFYWKEWKTFVWEQESGVMMSDDCLEQIVAKLKSLNKKRGRGEKLPLKVI